MILILFIILNQFQFYLTFFFILFFSVNVFVSFLPDQTLSISFTDIMDLDRLEPRGRVLFLINSDLNYVLLKRINMYGS